MAPDSIEGVFEAFKQLKVLVIGDAMVDTYSFGEVDRVSPEAPVPVVLLQAHDHRPGGAANVALNLKNLGAEPILCTVIGDDPSGQLLAQLLKDHEISTDQLVLSEDRRTTVKHRVMSGSKHLLRMDEEDDHRLTQWDREQLLKHIDEVVPYADLIIFEDYDKGCLDQEVIAEVMEKAEAHHIPTVADPKFRNYTYYQNLTLFKPNLREFRAAIGAGTLKAENPEFKRLVAASCTKSSHKYLMVTLSDQGVYYYGQQTEGHVKAHLRPIADVSGAGDTVAAIAGMCTATDCPIRFTAELANLGGSLVCEHQGVVPVNADQLRSEALKADALVDALATGQNS